MSADAAGVVQLEELFPNWESEALADVLATSRGNVEEAVNTLLQWTTDDSTGFTCFPAGGVASTGSESTSCARPKMEPVSPWHGDHLRMPAGGGPVPLQLERADFDRIMSSRFSRKCNNSRAIAEVLKVASVFKHHAHIHHVVSQHHSEKGTACARSMSNASPTAQDNALQEELARLTVNESIVAGKELLRERCAFVGVRTLEMADDGNCQFRAISQELFGTQDHHAAVRAEVVGYMERHATDYSVFFEAGEWNDYLSKMGMLKTWGDELTLRVAAEVFGVRVHVVTSTNESWYLVYESSAGVPTGARDLFLAYVAPIHYNTLVPLR